MNQQEKRSIQLFRTCKELEHLPNTIIITREPKRRREDVQKLLVALGSYDPLTLSHEAFFAEGLRAWGEELLILTSTNHVEKQIDPRKHALVHDRLLMQEAATPYTIGVTNTGLFVELVPLLEEAYPHAQFAFLVGMDVFKRIGHPDYYSCPGTAEKARQKLASYTFVVSERGEPAPKQPNVIPIKISNSISATAVREARKEGKSLDGLVSEPVKEIILATHLYEPNNKYQAQNLRYK